MSVSDGCPDKCGEALVKSLCTFFSEGLAWYGFEPVQPGSLGAEAVEHADGDVGIGGESIPDNTD